MRELRAEIEAATGCTASAGVGPSLLLARLATRRAKPNGQLLVTAREARSWGLSHWDARGIACDTAPGPSACLTRYHRAPGIVC